MVSDRLQRLAQLTAMSQGAAVRPDWNAVRSTLGHDVPADYRELIDNFGAGAYDNYIELLGPGEPIQLFNLLQRGLYWDEYLREDWEDVPEDMPSELQGRTFTIISWATTEDGVQMFWIAESGVPAEQWQIAFFQLAGENWEFFQQSTTQVLTRLVTGELPTSLVPRFPADTPVTFSRYNS
ncbi:hypothetical protein [Glycomyces harbinensis]|uniref:SMI1-KNR4 cell-wall n=1 Tax=Glycomyces harbinensis TaxID=58114 RepID=A0A1G6Y7T0_9ACTN|nr:hypothetical protein [Glycomyces harbinensis]SDD85646.1 hypothetical protein SAMN05216270_108147 [Glycomyces harbinensis]